MSNRTHFPEPASTKTSPIRVFADPHAVLRPLYRRLADDRGFHLIAESMQFDRLVEAAAEVSEQHAAKMRAYHAETTARSGRKGQIPVPPDE